MSGTGSGNGLCGFAAPLAFIGTERVRRPASLATAALQPDGACRQGFPPTFQG
jgi:hypothetical protein